jgi:hypothetical protein
MKIKRRLALLMGLLLTIAPVTFAAKPYLIYLNGRPTLDISSNMVKMIDGSLFVRLSSMSNELNIDYDYDLKKKTISISDKDEPQSEVVATNKEAGVTLYAKRRKGYLEDYWMEFVDKTIRYYPHWEKSSDNFGPRIFFEDINGNGKEEIVFKITTGHGTGYLMTKARVLQKTETNIGELYLEKLIEDPEIIIKKNVKMKKITDDKVEITIGKQR